MKQQLLEQQIADLQDENGKLRAEIDNLQAPKPAATIIDILGPEAFERMVELYPSFRESGTRTNPTDAASEVMWSCIRYLGRFEDYLERVESDRDAALSELKSTRAEHSDTHDRLDRANAALAEYAMRSVEEYF